MCTCVCVCVCVCVCINASYIVCIECQVRINESVRGKDVFIIQTGSCVGSEDEEGGSK